MNKRWWRGFCRNSSSISGTWVPIRRMVSARTPRSSGCCCSSTNSSSSADGVAREHLGVRHFQVIVADLKARVDRHRRPALREDGLAEQLQQHLVQQAHVHDGAVVLLHQLFDGEREAGVLVAEQLGELDLIVEQQAVFAPAGENVQPESHLPQEGLARLELAQLLARQEAVRHQLIERVGAEMALRDPADGLDVAQAPGLDLTFGSRL